MIKEFGIVAFLILVMNMPGMAWGQTASQTPEGIIAGSFYLFPVLEIKRRQDDNIYALPNGEVNDEITTAKAGVRIASNWSNHMLSLQGGVDLGRFTKETNEDYTDFSVLASARIDILRGVNIGANFGMSALHEDRGSPNDLSGSEPTRYGLVSGGLSFKHEVSALSLHADIKTEVYSYNDTPTSALIDVDQKGRNRIQMEGTTRLSLKIMDLNSFFIQGKYFARDYEFRDKSKYGYDRNSGGYEATLGYKREFSNTSLMELQFGQRDQQYLDEELPDISGLQITGLLSLNPSPLTHFRLFVNRSIEETVMSDVSGYFTTNYGVKLDKEFLSIFLMKASYSHNDLDYQGVDRKDTLKTAEVGLYVFMGSYISFGASYQNINRSSTAEGMDYQKSVVMVCLSGRI